MCSAAAPLDSERIAKQMLLPVRHPGRLVTSATIADRSGVQYSAPEVHDSGVQDTCAEVVGALVVVPLAGRQQAVHGARACVLVAVFRCVRVCVCVYVCAHVVQDAVRCF